MKTKVSAKIKIIAAAVISAALLIPFPVGYKDGGTVEYNAVLWSVRKEHSIFWSEHETGYNIGTVVRILFWNVYDDVEFVPERGNKGSADLIGVFRMT